MLIFNYGSEIMSKYEQANKNFEKINVNDILVSNESIIWNGKPKKSAYIINKVITMLPIALIWLIFDSTFIISFISLGNFMEMLWFIIPFFALHLMPVWIWLGNVLTAKKNWENTEYYVTNKRIIIVSGFIGMNYQTIFYKDINNVHLRIGIIDKLLKVGDIYFDTSENKMQFFLDLENPYALYTKLQKIVFDIQTDIEFPNNLRPNENNGYNTKYMPK